MVESDAKLFNKVKTLLHHDIIVVFDTRSWVVRLSKRTNDSDAIGARFPVIRCRFQAIDPAYCYKRHGRRYQFPPSSHRLETLWVESYLF